MLEKLLTKGADINKFNNKNQTPLHIAIKRKRKEIYRFLICQTNIDLKAKDIIC